MIAGKSVCMTRNPLLSVIVANYNYGRFLETAVQSVIEQNGFDECELIVVDGGSTDDSVEIIRKYSDRIAWWVSEPDEGQSDAFNKGFAKARGKYLTWLNADDVLLPGALKRMLESLKAHPESDWLAGNTVYFNGDLTVRVATVPVGEVWPRVLRVPGWMLANGPSTIFSKHLLEKVGPIRLDLRYVMDIELWMRFAETGLRPRSIPGYVWGFRLHEDSKTSSSISSGTKDEAFVRERTAIRVEHRVNPRREVLAVWCKRLSGLLSGGLTRRWSFGRRYYGRPLGLLETKCDE